MYNNKEYLINYLIALIPLTIVLGNLAININIILISFLGLIFYGKQIFLFEDKKFKYLIYSFFIYLIIITFLNNFTYFNTDSLHKENFFKSIFFLRFLLFFLVLNIFLKSGQFNIKIFFISCAFLSIFLSIDIIYQRIFLEDLFGYPIIGRRASGFFGSELVAGGFLQKFSLITIFFIFFYFKKISNINFYLILIFILFFIPIFLTMNRMPTIIFFFSYIFFLIFEKKIKSLLLIVVCSALIVLFFFKNFENTEINYHLKNFYSELNQFVKETPKVLSNTFVHKNKKNTEISGYLKLFDTGLRIWKENIIFGNGLKSIRVSNKYGIHQAFNTHPHNYLIELLADTGLVGFLIFYSMSFIVLKECLKMIYIKKIDYRFKYVYYPFVLILFAEVFPIRSTGSFFSTANAYLIFFCIALLFNIKNFEKKFL